MMLSSNVLRKTLYYSEKSIHLVKMCPDITRLMAIYENISQIVCIIAYGDVK